MSKTSPMLWGSPNTSADVSGRITAFSIPFSSMRRTCSSADIMDRPFLRFFSTGQR